MARFRRAMVLRRAVLLLSAAAAATTTTTDDTRRRTAAPQRFSALGVLLAAPGLRPRIGSVTKHAGNPLFTQDRLWEAHLDNSYPNVVHAPGDRNGDWQLWYGNYNAAGQYLQFANSSDGIRWTKPDLGRYTFTTKQFPGLEHLGAHNNIIMYGGGLGMFRDPNERDPSRRMKISGGAPAGCYSADGAENCVVGTAASPDGIHNWTDVAKLDFPPPWRPDCHTNVFYDEVRRQYIMTTRDRISTPAHPNRERVISISRSGASAAGGAPRYGTWRPTMHGEFPGTTDAGPCVHLGAADPVKECGEHCRSLPGCRYFWVYTTGSDEPGMCCPKLNITDTTPVKPRHGNGTFFEMELAWVETGGIRYCGGGTGWYRFNTSAGGPFGAGCGAVPCTSSSGCPNVPASWSDEQGIAACEALCAPDGDCLGFTWYPGNHSSGKLTSCCFRSGSVASKPKCATCTARCYQKPPPPSPGGNSSFGDWSIPTITMMGNTSHQLYSQVTFRFHDVYLGLVMVFDASCNTVNPPCQTGPDAGHVHCRLAWSPDGEMTKWSWVDEGGLTGADFIPAGPSGTFDSHVTFAAHLPVTMPEDGTHRLYYMGGDGPHDNGGHDRSGAGRNTSFGLATLRADGFAGIAGTGSTTTRSLRATGTAVTITVDMLGPDGAVMVSVLGQDAATKGTVRSNVTNHAVCFKLTVGDNVTLSLEIKDAIVYTVGFANVMAPPDPRLRPIFHVPVGNPPGFVGDANGLVYRDGVFHMMWQGAGSTWEHAVSSDHVFWAAMPTAFGPGAMSGGSVLLPDGAKNAPLSQFSLCLSRACLVKRIVLYINCSKRAFFAGDVVAIFKRIGQPAGHWAARPDDLRDPLLTNWSFTGPVDGIGGSDLAAAFLDADGQYRIVADRHDWKPTHSLAQSEIQMFVGNLSSNLTQWQPQGNATLHRYKWTRCVNLPAECGGHTYPCDPGMIPLPGTTVSVLYGMQKTCNMEGREFYALGHYDQASHTFTLLDNTSDMVRAAITLSASPFVDYVLSGIPRRSLSMQQYHTARVEY
jgi:hypothetical protein